jgi:hypothetical protein
MQTEMGKTLGFAMSRAILTEGLVWRTRRGGGTVLPKDVDGLVSVRGIAGWLCYTARGWPTRCPPYYGSEYEAHRTHLSYGFHRLSHAAHVMPSSTPPTQSSSLPLQISAGGVQYVGTLQSLLHCRLPEEAHVVVHVTEPPHPAHPLH